MLTDARSWKVSALGVFVTVHFTSAITRRWSRLPLTITSTPDNAIIAYYAKEPHYTPPWKQMNMMKEMVRENLGRDCKLYSNTATTDTARIMAGLMVAEDTPSPSISKKFAWEKLKTNLDEICNDVRQQGYWLGLRHGQDCKGYG